METVLDMRPAFEMLSVSIGTLRPIHYLSCSMDAISCILCFLIYTTTSKVRNCLLNACMNCTKVLIVVGHIFIMIRSRRKKYSHLNLVVMVKRLPVKMPRIRSSHSRLTWRQMLYYFIQAASFLKNIRTERLLLFMV